MSVKKLNWGILGTGFIANIFAQNILQSSNNNLVAIASRDLQKSAQFAKKFNIPEFYDNYLQLIKDKKVDIVYIALPTVLHEEWIIKAAESKKHILCEKPFTLNFLEGEKALKIVKKSEVFCTEGFMYRFHPQTRKIIDLIKTNSIGKIHLIQSLFAWNSTNDSNSNNTLHLGGGGINSLGSYCVSMSRLIAGLAQGKTFANPKKIQASGNIGLRGIDEFSSAVLTFSNTCYANIYVSMQHGIQSQLYIVGDKGSLIIDDPWLPEKNSTIKLQLNENNPGSEKFFSNPSNFSSYFHEIEAISKCINRGQMQIDSPGLSWDDTLGNMHSLSLWRKEIGLKYYEDEF